MKIHFKHEFPIELQEFVRKIIRKNHGHPKSRGRLARFAISQFPDRLRCFLREARRDWSIRKSGGRFLRLCFNQMPAPLQGLVRRSGVGPMLRRQGFARAAELNQASRAASDTFFDGQWYLSHYQDVAAAGYDPFDHYLRFGMAERRSPGPCFDAEAYLQAHPDVAAAGRDPLLHFVLTGAAEGRRFFVHPEALGLASPAANPAASPAASPAARQMDDEEIYRMFRIVDEWSPAQAAAMQAALSALPYRPLISVLMPVHHPDLAHLEAAVASVTGQAYPHWQLCIADDGTHSSDLTRWLEALAAGDPRIVVTTRSTRGHISAATNSAAATADGDFLLLLDQDDCLSKDALARCALAIGSAEDVDYLFSDSDKLDAEGRHFAPHFKPPFSPELLLNYMCAGQVVCIRAALWRQLGGLREGFEGSQDHDLALRATERARRVVHIPSVLYHWRSVAGSTAQDGNSKPYSFAAGLRAVQEALARRGCRGRVTRPAWAIAAGNAVFDLSFDDGGPMVGIVIPMRNGLALTRACIESLHRTTYLNFRIVIVDNGSEDPDTLAWLAALPLNARLSIQVLRLANEPGEGFNFSRLVNAGVRALDTEFVLLLNNDTEVVAPDWLSAMVGYGQMPGVGAVGALLLYPDGSVQHAGVYHSGRPPGHVGHRLRGAPATTHDLRFVRNVSAVTGACMLIRRATYLELGGFNETDFAVAYNDVDFCFRLRAAGGRIVFAPNAVLRHHESATRGQRDNPAELAALRARHRQPGDAYVNPNIVIEDRPVLQPRRAILALGRPLRLLVCSHNLNREGAPMALLEACRWIARKGDAIITLRSPLDGPLHEAYRRAGIAVEIVPHPLAATCTATEYDEQTLLRGRRMVERGFDVVVGNTLVEFHSVDAAHEARLPSIWLVHENEGLESHVAQMPLEVQRRARACFGHPWRVVFVAEASRQVYRALNFHNNAIVVPGGIEAGWAEGIDAAARLAARRALGAAPDDVVILAMGTLCERKRQADLVQAFARLGEEQPRLRLVIVGGGEAGYAARLVHDVSLLPDTLRARVHILPESAAPQFFYAAADVFALCSVQESYPRVILEAMAAGLPIVATAVGGVPEQVQTAVNATLYPAGDVAALTAALRVLCADVGLRAQYGVASTQIHRALNTSDDVGRALWQVVREAAGAGVMPSRIASL